MRGSARSRALGIVIASCEYRVDRILDVDHMQPTTTRPPPGTRTHDVKELGSRVSDHVVGAEHFSVRHVRLEIHGFITDLTKAGQVKDLHPVGTGSI